MKSSKKKINNETVNGFYKRDDDLNVCFTPSKLHKKSLWYSGNNNDLFVENTYSKWPSLFIEKILKYFLCYILFS